MKILHIIGGLAKAAGTSVFCAELSNELVARGHEVTIAVCNPDDGDLYSLDSRVRLASIDAVVQSASSSDFDLVHIHALWSPVLHNVAKWAHNKNIPVVWSPHGMLQKWALKNKWWKKLAGLALYQWRDLHSATLLHATAQSEVEDIRRLGLKNKVVVAPLGVRLPVSANRTIEQPEQSNNRKTLLFVSRVQKKKGLPNLIDAWSRLPEDLRKDWQIRIVGPDQDNHTAELKVQCDRLGIGWHDCLAQSSNRTIEQSNIVFVGPKYDDGLSAEYDNADLFVLPTHSENFGSVVIEALAHCVPVITTKQAPWAELEEFKCGWWIDDTADALTAALRVAIEQSNNPNNRTILYEMGRRGRKFVDDRYTWSAVCDKIIEGYQNEAV